MDSRKLGFNANFQSEVPPFLKCTSCNFVLRKPVMASNCFHRFCFQCMEKMKHDSNALGSSLVCPEDQIKIIVDEIYEDGAIEKTIRNLPVCCNYVERGCYWKGKLEVLEAHVGQCSFGDTESMSLREMFRNLSKKMEELEKDAADNKTEVASLKKDLAIANEESKSVRAELFDAKSEILCLKQNFKDERKRFCREKQEVQLRFLTVEQSMKQLKDNIARNEDTTKLKEETENLMEEKLNKVSKKGTAMDADLASLNTQLTINANVSGNSKEDYKEEADEVRGAVAAGKSDAAEMVFVHKFDNMNRLKEIGGTYYGEKFSCTQNGHRFRLVIKQDDSDWFSVGMQGCRGRSDEVADFNMKVSFSGASRNGKEWNSGYSRGNYGSKFEHPGEEWESEENIFWAGPLHFKYDVIDDTFTLTCTMEVQ